MFALASNHETLKNGIDLNDVLNTYHSNEAEEKEETGGCLLEENETRENGAGLNPESDDSDESDG